MQTMQEPMKIEPMKIAYSAEPMKIQYPVAKTFIQYPALRNPSLEAFFQEREISSCPASRMPSIDEEQEDAKSTTTVSSDSLKTIAKDIEYTIKNTFIDYPGWESLRNPSLEGFFQERELKSCPATRMQSLDDSQESSPEVLYANLQEATWNIEQPALRSISLEECIRNIEAKYQDLEVCDDISTKANSEEDTAPPTPQILSDSEEESKLSNRAISLTDSLGLWSLGSAEHSLGNCKPCAFLWKSEQGCQNGTNCKFCHMCTPGEVKRRKKAKLAARKMMRQFNQAPFAQGAGFYGVC
jgi:hypothetical protein